MSNGTKKPRNFQRRPRKWPGNEEDEINDAALRESDMIRGKGEA